MSNSDQILGRVIVVEPNAALRSALLTLLAAERYEVESCNSLEQVVLRSNNAPHVVALVAWQSMQGLLTEEHRHNLYELTRRLRLVLMVPRRWARLLDQTDLGVVVTGFVAKPFEADELLHALQQALLRPAEITHASR
jgi:FixJ family two-component response regulator